MSIEEFPIATFESVVEGTQYRTSPDEEWQPAEEGIQLFEGSQVRHAEKGKMYALNLLDRCIAEFTLNECLVEVDDCRNAEYTETGDEWAELQQHDQIYCVGLRTGSNGFAEIEARDVIKLTFNEDH